MVCPPQILRLCQKLKYLEVFICTAVQIILWLFAQVHCRAAFTLSSRLPLFVYTLQLTVLYVAGGDAMLTGEDEGETNTNSLVVQWRAAQLCHAPWGDRGCDQSQLPQGQRWAFVHCWHIAAMDTMEEEGETNTNSLESMTSCPTLPMFEVLWIERGGNAWPFSPSCFLSSPTTKASSIPRWRRFWQDLCGVFVQGGQLLQRGLPLQARVVGCQPELTPSPPSVSLWTTSLRSSLELRWGTQVSIDFNICQYWDLILHRLLAPATLNLEPGRNSLLIFHLF